MIVTDPQQGDNPIIFANPAAAALTGYAIGELVGQNYRMLFGPGTDPTMIDRPVERPAGSHIRQDFPDPPGQIAVAVRLD